eukprot:3080105-Rhodomonas_salina.3
MSHAPRHMHSQPDSQPAAHTDTDTDTQTHRHTDTQTHNQSDLGDMFGPAARGQTRKGAVSRLLELTWRQRLEPASAKSQRNGQLVSTLGTRTAVECI